MASSKASQYSTAKVLHWVAAVLIGFNLMSGWRISTFDMDVKLVLITIHASVGIAIFAFMVLRWWWRRRNDLYVPPGWWKRKAVVLQWVFYPLLLIQPVLGSMVAIFNDYAVRAFGVLDLSAVAGGNRPMRALFLGLHEWMAILLIVLVLAHGFERTKRLFMDDSDLLQADA